MKKSHLKSLLYSGAYIEFRDISICFLPNHLDGVILRPGFQVHAEHRRLKNRVYSEIHYSIDEAVDKFLGLKRFLYEKKVDDSPQLSADRQVSNESAKNSQDTKRQGGDS